MLFDIKVTAEFTPDDHIGVDINSIAGIVLIVMKQLEWHGAVNELEVTVKKIE